MGHFVEPLWPYFGWLVRSTVQASVLIVLILSLQIALRRRLTPRLRYALWLILLVRMVMPWAPESGLSMYNLVPPVQDQGGVASGNPFFSGWAWRESALARPDRVNVPSGIVPASPVPLSVDGTPSVDVAPNSVSIRHVLVPIWLIGMALLACCAVASCLAFWFRIRDARPVTDRAVLGLLDECRARMGVVRGPVLIETSRIKGPALFGLFRPRLLLPEGLMAAFGPDQLRHIFLHELAHLKRHDIAANLLATLLQIVHWFNPLVWLAFYRMRSDRESACDAMALERLQPGEPHRYAETIIALVERYSRPRPVPVIAGILDGKSRLTGRIAMISRFPRSPYRWTVLGMVFVAAIGCTALTNARGKAAAAASEESLNAKIARINLETVTMDDIIAVLGKPEKYWLGNRTFNENDLPDMYFASYPTGVVVWKMAHGIEGIRFTKPGFVVHGSIQVGSTLDELKKVCGEPDRVIQGKEGGWDDGSTNLDGYYYRSCRPPFRVLVSDGKVVYLDLLVMSKGNAQSDSARQPVDQDFARGLQVKVTQFNIAKAKVEDVVRVFGEPLRYFGNNKELSKVNLPACYIMNYPAMFSVYIANGRVEELRFDAPGSVYTFRDRLRIGSTLQDVLEVLGPPARTVERRRNLYTDGILYKDIEGWKGRCYYARRDQGVRMFFEHDRVTALYLTPVQTGKTKPNWANLPSDDDFARQLPAKVAQLDINKAVLADVIKLFGEPGEYEGPEGGACEKDKLPSLYQMRYPAGFSVVMTGGGVAQLSFHEPGYAYMDKIQVGSTLLDVIAALGPPPKTIEGQSWGETPFKRGVFYKGINGVSGNGYYAPEGHDIRLFFWDDKINRLCIHRTDPASP